MHHKDLEIWRKRHGFTQEVTAKTLGLSPRMVRYYLQGAQPIPQTVELACFAIDALELAITADQGGPVGAKAQQLKNTLGI